MQIKRMRLFWISVGIAALVALLALHEILLPFAVGAAAAYLLNPLVDRLERFGIKRTVSALGLVLLFAAGLAVGALVALPVLLGEVRFFFDQFPHYLFRLQSIALDSSKPWLHDLLGHDLHVEESSTDIISKLGGSWLDEVATSMWAGGVALLSLFSLVVVAPIVTIYLIIDWHRMIATVDSWIAPEYRSDVHAVTREIQDTISGFVRGQILICLLLALFYTAALRVIGLDHAIILGVAAGLISFVPYLGAATGLVLSTCVGLVQFWPDWLPVIAVAAIFAIGETIADYVLAPRVIGRRVKLSPVWLLFALSASGWLFGFVGLVVAVPLAASIRVLLQFAFQRSQAPSRIDYDAREV
jgi:predicted PurR-regulated permease PerM